MITLKLSFLNQSEINLQLLVIVRQGIKVGQKRLNEIKGELAFGNGKILSLTSAM
jgi:hypothetical protein